MNRENPFIGMSRRLRIQDAARENAAQREAALAERATQQAFKPAPFTGPTSVDGWNIMQRERRAALEAELAAAERKRDAIHSPAEHTLRVAFAGASAASIKLDVDALLHRSISAENKAEAAKASADSIAVELEAARLRAPAEHEREAQQLRAGKSVTADPAAAEAEVAKLERHHAVLQAAAAQAAKVHADAVAQLAEGRKALEKATCALLIARDELLAAEALDRARDDLAGVSNIDDDVKRRLRVALVALI